MANAIAPMLRCASHVAFIDPYFQADNARFRLPLEAFLQDLFEEPRCTTIIPTIELHTGIERFYKSRDPRSDEDEKSNAESIIRNCERYLPRIIPKELSVKVIIWKNKPGGDRLHNRYVYTNIGSVRFGVGLDCFDAEEITSDDEEPKGPTDEINCCSEETHKSLWKKYLGKTPSFQLVIPAIEIHGRK